MTVERKATKADKARRQFDFMMSRAVELLDKGEKLEAALQYAKASQHASSSGNMDANGQYSMWSSLAHKASVEMMSLVDFGPGSRFTQPDSLFRPMVERIEFCTDKLANTTDHIEAIELTTIIYSLCNVALEMLGPKGTDWFADRKMRAERALLRAKILQNPPPGFLGFCVHKGCNEPVYENTSHVTLPEKREEVNGESTHIPTRYIHMDCVTAAASEANVFHV